MDFSIVESGYDRDEVDRCLADLGEQLAFASAQAASAAEARAELALVRRDADRLHALLKARPAVYRNTLRIQQMVALAEEEAAEILAEARAEREAAHAEAERIREEAYEEATRARRDFEAALQARRRREQLAEETWKRVRVEAAPPRNGGPRTTPQAAPNRAPGAVRARPGPGSNEGPRPSPGAGADAGRNARTNDGAAEPVGPRGDASRPNAGPSTPVSTGAGLADAAPPVSGAPPNPGPPNPGPPSPGPPSPGPSSPEPSSPAPTGVAPADRAPSASGASANAAPAARVTRAQTDPARASVAQTEPAPGDRAQSGATASEAGAGDPAERPEGDKPTSRWPRLRNLLPSPSSR
ncbi:MAG TPA: hypothetical protein VI011_11965 [Asanoa sp.]